LLLQILEVLTVASFKSPRDACPTELLLSFKGWLLAALLALSPQHKVSLDIRQVSNDQLICELSQGVLYLSLFSSVHKFRDTRLCISASFNLLDSCYWNRARLMVDWSRTCPVDWANASWLESFVKVDIPSLLSFDAILLDLFLIGHVLLFRLFQDGSWSSLECCWLYPDVSCLIERLFPLMNDFTNVHTCFEFASVCHCLWEHVDFFLVFAQMVYHLRYFWAVPLLCQDVLAHYDCSCESAPKFVAVLFSNELIFVHRTIVHKWKAEYRRASGVNGAELDLWRWWSCVHFIRNII